MDGWKDWEEWLLNWMNSPKIKIAVTLSGSFRLETFIFHDKFSLNTVVVVLSCGMLNVKTKKVEGFQGIICNLNKSFTLNIH